MQAEAEPTSMPKAGPMLALVGTKTYGTDLSSQIIGRCATTSGGWTSSAIITSFATPRSIAFVVSFVLFLTLPDCFAWRSASKAASEISFGVSNFTKYGLGISKYTLSQWINYFEREHLVWVHLLYLSTRPERLHPFPLL